MLCIIMLIPALVQPAAAKQGMENFKKTLTYEGSVFTDISGKWFEGDVKDAYEYGIVEGRGEGLFAPYDTITVAEAITMACRIHSTYFDANIPHSPGGWYTKYVKYALSVGIININQFSDYTAVATRSQLAVMIFNALPDSEYAQINSVSEIPDVQKNKDNGNKIFALYRAGVLTGGEDGSFRPNDSINRAEAVTILDRAIDPERRVEFTLGDGTNEDPRGDTEVYVKLDTNGKLLAALSLNTTSGDFAFYSYTVNSTWAAAGKFDTDGKSVICLLGENYMDTQPGADVTAMYFSVTSQGLMLSSLTSASNAKSIGNLNIGDVLTASR